MVLLKYSLANNEKSYLQYIDTWNTLIAQMGMLQLVTQLSLASFYTHSNQQLLTGIKTSMVSGMDYSSY